MDKVKKNVLWNTFGSIAYLGCLWLLSVVVVRLTNIEENSYNAGILSLALSISNIFVTIAMFNVRNYQVSDHNNEFNDSEYISHRIITCVLSFLLCFIFVLFNGYDTEKFLCVLLYFIMRSSEAFSDVLYGAAQKEWRLDIAGKSTFFKGILLLISFSLVLFFSQNLVLAFLSMTIVVWLVVLLFDIPQIIKLKGKIFSIHLTKMWDLTKKCFPIFAYGLCINSITSVGRYFLEKIQGEDVLGFYSSISTIAVIVQSLALYVFTSFNGVFTENFEQYKINKSNKLIIKCILFICAIILLGFGCSALLGDFVISLLFGEKFLPYVPQLYPTILISALLSLVWLFGMVLTILRKNLFLMISSLIAFLMNGVLSVILIPSMSYEGVNLSCLISFGAALIAFALYYFIVTKKLGGGVNNDAKTQFEV